MDQGLMAVTSLLRGAGVSVGEGDQATGAKRRVVQFDRRGVVAEAAAMD